MVDLEDRGIPTVFVSTVEFIDAAHAQAKALGTIASAVYVEHPIQDRTDEEMIGIADHIFDQVIEGLVKN